MVETRPEPTKIRRTANLAHLEEADTDLLREMVRTFVQSLMSAEADAV